MLFKVAFSVTERHCCVNEQQKHFGFYSKHHVIGEYGATIQQQKDKGSEYIHQEQTQDYTYKLSNKQNKVKGNLQDEYLDIHEL